MLVEAVTPHHLAKGGLQCRWNLLALGRDLGQVLGTRGEGHHQAFDRGRSRTRSGSCAAGRNRSWQALPDEALSGPRQRFARKP